MTKPNETSPLLSSKLQNPQTGGNATASSSDRKRNVQQLMRRALYVIIPLAVLALVGLGWLFAGGNDDSDDAERVTTKSPHLRNTDGKSYTDQELLALLPPFVARGHPIPPKIINRAAFPGAIPTNAFWTNLLVGDDHGLNPGM